MTLRDYITRYAHHAMNKQADALVEAIGVDRGKLEALLALDVNERNINDYGRFDSLIATVDKKKAKDYFERVEGKSIPPFKVNMRVDRLFPHLLKAGGIDIE